VDSDNEPAERLLEMHAACCGKIDALRAAAAGEPSALLDALEQVKAELEQELAALADSFRRPFP
jgi:hypothetical protein